MSDSSMRASLWRVLKVYSVQHDIFWFGGGLCIYAILRNLSVYALLFCFWPTFSDLDYVAFV